MAAMHDLVARAAIVTLCALSVASCSDEVVPLSRSRAPDGAFIAQYAKINYGGASGGVTYCVDILDTNGRLLEECALAIIHEPEVSFDWSPGSLRICVNGGQITHHTDAPITSAKGPTLRVTYQDANGGRCTA